LIPVSFIRVPNMPVSALIKLENLRMLAEVGSIHTATIVGQRGGYAVVARVGLQERTLATKYGRVRLFSSADAAAKVLREAGLGQATLDFTHYEPGRLRAARPDTTARFQRAAEALEHDAWFRDQVQQSLDTVRDGRAVWHDHDALFDRLEAHAAQRVTERGAGRTLKVAKPSSPKAR